MKTSLLHSTRFSGLFLLLFATIFAVSCQENKDEVATLTFPSTFVFTELRNSITQIYRSNEDGLMGTLTREQAGSFVGFLDTMGNYNNDFKKLGLDFTSVEFLDASRVRIFSDGSMGIPAFDTIVGYINQGTNIVSLTLDWTLRDAPLIFNLSDSGGNYLALTPIWFSNTYTPLIPPFTQKYTPVRLVYFASGQQPDLFRFLQADATYGDFGRGDTVAVHVGVVYFR